MGHALVAEKPGEARIEKIIAPRIQHILGDAEDKLTKITVVDADRGKHGYTADLRSPRASVGVRLAIRQISGPIISRGRTL
jgi:hypothetical protein